MAQLVNVIDNNDQKIVERCVGTARNLVWLNVAVHELLRALRLGACLLIVSGVTNQFFYLVTPALIFAALSVLLIWAAASALLKRPGRMAAANIVDERYATRSLLTTAMELLSPNAKKDSVFAPWIIRQAAQTAAQSLKQLNSAELGEPYKTPWLEMGLLVLGVFLIFQPVKNNTALSERSPGESKEASEPLLQAAKTDLIAEIRQANLTGQPAATSEPNPPDESAELSHETASSASASKIERDEASGAAIMDEAGPAKMPADEVSDSNHYAEAQWSRQRPGQGIGSDADHEPTTASNETQLNAPIKYLAIPLRDGQAVSDNKGNVPYNNDYRMSESNKPPIRASMSKVEKTSTPINSVLTFGQQHYVNNYFKQSLSKQ